jgi:hypothetical protein
MRSLLKFFGSASPDKPASAAADAARARRAAQPQRPSPRRDPTQEYDVLAKHRQTDWTKVRSPARPTDQKLTEQAAGWAVTLPPRMRPIELLRQYPRVANRVALCWKDRLLMSALFDDLLMDKRGGRKGFPPEVAAELKRLHQFHCSLTGAGSHDPWAANSLAVGDR